MSRHRAAVVVASDALHAVHVYTVLCTCSPAGTSPRAPPCSCQLTHTPATAVPPTVPDQVPFMARWRRLPRAISMAMLSLAPSNRRSLLVMTRVAKVAQVVAERLQGEAGHRKHHPFWHLQWVMWRVQASKPPTGARACGVATLPPCSVLWLPPGQAVAAAGPAAGKELEQPRAMTSRCWLGDCMRQWLP